MRPAVLLITIVTLLSTTIVWANPGLVAVYSDGKQAVHRVVPTPNFTLSANESVHSQIAPKFEAVYTGVLKISRGGEYVISAGAQIEVDGNDVAGKTLALAAGDHPLKVSYSREAGAARLQLRWKSNFFGEEPIPPSALAHNHANNALTKKWAQIEQGRALYENLSCGACHGASGWNLSTQRGPDLSDIGSRVTSGWLAAWLKNPRHYRKTAVMPSLLSDEKEVRDTAAFLSSLTTSPSDAVKSVADPKRIAAGKEIFGRIGCVKCHNDTGNSLAGVGTKYSSSHALAKFIIDPLYLHPSGRMPQMFNPKTQSKEAAMVAEFLFHTNKRAEPWPKDSGPGDAKRGRELVQYRGCIACHKVNHDDQRLAGSTVSPQFVSHSGSRLLHYWPFDDNTQDAVAANHGRLTGKESFTAGADKITGSKAFDFDGKTYLKLSHFKRPNVMTITAWIKTSRGGEILAWSKPQVGTREFRVNVNGKDTLIYGENNIDGQWKLAVGKSAVLIDNQWHHVAVVRDGVRAQVYLDGKSLGDRGTVQLASGAYSDTLLIGAIKNGNTPHRNFHGALDDLALWRDALSGEEIRVLAQGGSAAKFAEGAPQTIVRFDSTKGCLANAPAKGAPDYHLSAADRSSLQAFMNSTTTQPVIASAPVETFYRRVAQFNCTACHALNDLNNGPAKEVTEEGLVRTIERPPSLTAAGDKLQIRWIQNVLLNQKRTRGWMKMRMPHFGSRVQQLSKLFPAASGSTLVDESPQPKIELAKTGLETIGAQRGKVACINCHSYRGINRQKDGVVPAPDMSEIGQTLRRDWFVRWLHNPTRMTPGTSMPQFFLELKPEQREQKIDQLWAALFHQARLPLPKGLLDLRTEGTKIVVGEEPVLFRFSTRVPPKMRIDRAINVGLPGGTNFTFDAAKARLVYAWKGAFIDAGPAWNGRGGKPVSVSGETLYTAPAAFPLRIGSVSTEPKVRFLGTYLVKMHPVFRYTVDGVEIHERIDVTESELVRRFTIDEASKPVFFLGDAKRAYTSSSGTFKDGVLEVPAGKKIEFELRSKHQ
jgi:mono/diheme cytochrome c family protein